MIEESNNSATPRYFSAAASLIALAGLADAAYLTANHFAGTAVPCNVLSGCESVLNSSYAEFFGIPTALFGAVAYFTAFSLAFLVFFGNHTLWRIFGALSVLMFIASLGFVYLQAFVIGAYCQYCLLSAVTSTLLFLTYTASLLLGRK